MSEQKIDPESSSERRDFLKGGLAVAGGTAALAAGAGVQDAEASDPMPGRSVHLAVKPGVDAKTVVAALERIFELSGCPACGLNGLLDVRINVINPAINDRFKQGILGVSENLRGF
jgi:anaerobic selenocysteine-containing dehydrogenase